MQENILFFSDKCPDTTEFVQRLKDRAIPYREVNITESMSNLKEFLKIRDHHPAFKQTIEEGKVGVPCLKSGQDVIINVEEL